MHSLQIPEPATSQAVRAEVFATLAEYTSAGSPRHIRVGLLFLKVCDRLARAGVIPERPDGQEFERLSYSYPSVSFPDFNVPGQIADLVRQTLWELYTERVLAPAPQARAILDTDLNRASFTPLAIYLDLDHVMLTDYGVKILSNSGERIVVHDPDAYLSRFWVAEPPPDPEMMRYLSESLSVFRSNHLVASVVLLGVASERLIEVLAESLRDALGDPQGSSWYSRYRKKDVSKKFSSITNKLKEEYKQLDLNTESFRAAELTFQHIRLARNDIAHPRNRQFTWNEVSGFLHSFVQYFVYANQIIALLASNARSQHST